MRDERRTPVLTGSKKGLTGRARRVEVEISYMEPVDLHILQIEDTIRLEIISMRRRSDQVGSVERRA
jgi:hypothetical protein